MIDPEAKYTAALARLKAAEQNYADAETELIRARREVGIAQLGTRYHAMLRRPVSDKQFVF